MDRTPVTSSNIKAVGYDAATQTLEVEFGNGGVYAYADVPAEMHAKLMAAESVGKFLAQHIKGQFAHKRAE